MEIYLGRRGVRQIRDAATDAVEDSDTEALREEILDAFSDEDVQAIEHQLGGEDLYDFISVMLDDWSGDEVDELFELMESHFAEIGIELTTDYANIEASEVLEDDDDFPPEEEFEEEEEL
jgi:hypothetical protein